MSAVLQQSPVTLCWRTPPTPCYSEINTYRTESWHVNRGFDPFRWATHIYFNRWKRPRPRAHALHHVLLHKHLGSCCRQKGRSLRPDLQGQLCLVKPIPCFGLRKWALEQGNRVTGSWEDALLGSSSCLDTSSEICTWVAASR